MPFAGHTGHNFRKLTNFWMLKKSLKRRETLISFVLYLGGKSGSTTEKRDHAVDQRDWREPS